LTGLFSWLENRGKQPTKRQYRQYRHRERLLALRRQYSCEERNQRCKDN
jgi:hypothetical protein